MKNFEIFKASKLFELKLDAKEHFEKETFCVGISKPFHMILTPALKISKIFILQQENNPAKSCHGNW